MYRGENLLLLMVPNPKAPRKPDGKNARCSAEADPPKLQDCETLAPALAIEPI
jgi:hypothetical protein